MSDKDKIEEINEGLQDAGGPQAIDGPKGLDGLRRLYGRRKGHDLSARQQDLYDNFLPRIRIPDLRAEGSTLDPQTLFEDSKKDFWLEVGFGKGEHIAWQAEHFPDTGMIACEPYMNGVAGLLVAIEEKNISNIRIYDYDARNVMHALPDASLGRAFLLHPDPWPKTRHAKRRFVSQVNLDEFARLLKDGAELRIGTDHPVYTQWTMTEMAKRDDFVWMANCADDWRQSPDDWPKTRYETKQKDGIPVYLRFKRLPR